VKTDTRARRILHVDLDSFFVCVERSLDASLQGEPLIVGGEGSEGIVAAASAEARAKGVRVGQSLAAARRSCPTGVYRSGDLDAYARVSDEVTCLLLSASRRVERPSIDEAYVDLSPEETAASSPVAATERLKEGFQRRLGLDASFGLASSRLAARIASARARPRGLLIVLPGYEDSFLARQPVAALSDLPEHLERALLDAGLPTLGDVLAADDALLVKILGRAAAGRIREAAAGRGEAKVQAAAPPVWIQEEASVRDRSGDKDALAEILHGLVRRACRRLRPFGLVAGSISVEVGRGELVDRRTETLEPGSADEETLTAAAAALGAPLLEPAPSVRRLTLRLARLDKPSRQEPLFPTGSESPRARLL
jgi:DNA polymerase-4